MQQNHPEVGLTRSRFGPVLLAVMVIVALTAATQLRPSRTDEQTTRSAIALPPSVAATETSAATAAVNEEYSWGLEIEGLNLLVSPALDAVRIEGKVSHGGVYEIICWAVGERVTNGNDENPTDDATTFTSDIWWKIHGPSAEGFISNVWFAREVDTKLKTAQCR